MNKYNGIIVLDNANDLRIELLNIFNDIENKIIDYQTNSYPYSTNFFKIIYNKLNIKKQYSDEEMYYLFEMVTNKVLNELKKQNYKTYKQIISLMYHDYILNIHDEENQYSSEELQIFEYIKKQIKNNDDLVSFLDKQNIFYNDLLENFLTFNELSYLNKRKLFLKTSYLDKYLTQILPYHFIDKLYYTIRYNEYTIINLFQKYNLDGILYSMGFLQNLANSDNDNYKELLLPLLECFYKNTLYKIINAKYDIDSMKLFNRIEKQNINTLMDELKKETYNLELIVKQFYDYIIIYNDQYKNKVNEEYAKANIIVKQKLKKLK